MTRDRLYLRVSTAAQAKKDTPIPIQRARCADASAATGGEIAGEYVEPGRSGSLHPRKRPELRRALEDARRGEYDRLIVYDSRRMSRDFDLSGWLRVELSEAGVEVLDASAPGAPDEARQVNTIVAHLERKAFVQRSRDSASLIRRERRKYGPHDILGYTWEGKTRRVPDPLTRGRVLEIFEAADRHETIRSIAAAHRMDARRVRMLLRNPVYVGAHVSRYRYGIPQEVQPGAHEPLIPQDLWERVQERLDRQAASCTHGEWGTLPLTGLLVCRSCRRSLQVVRTRRGHRWYGCGAHPSVDVTGWESQILAAVVEYLAAPQIARAIADQVNAAMRHGEDTGQARAELATLRNAQERLIQAITLGSDLDIGPLTDRLRETQRAIQRTERRLAAMANRGRVLVSAQTVQARLRELAADATRADRGTLHRLVEQITVAAGEPAEITLADVGSSGSRDSHLWPRVDVLVFHWRPAA